MATGSATSNTCIIDLVQHKRSKLPQTTESLLRKIEQENPHIRQCNSNDPSAKFANPKGQLPSAQLRGRLSEHEDHFGGRALPRGALPKMDGALMDRYQAVRRNMMMLGALAEHKQPPPKPGKLGAKRLAAAAAAAARGSNGSRDEGGSTARRTRSSGGSRDASQADDDLDDDGASSVAASEYGNRRLRPLDSSRSGRSTARTMQRSDSRASRASRASCYDDDRGRTPDCSGPRVRGRHLRKSVSQTSGHSTGTLRSETSIGTSRTQRSRYSARRRSGGHVKVKPKPGRVTRALKEFGGQDDWVSKVLLRHFLAAVIQARWKGYIVRKRFKANAAKLVDEEKARWGLQEEQDARRSVHSAGTIQSAGGPGRSANHAGGRQPKQQHNQQHPQHAQQQSSAGGGAAGGSRRNTASPVPRRGTTDMGASQPNSIGRSGSPNVGRRAGGGVAHSSSVGSLAGMVPGRPGSQEAYVAHMRLAQAAAIDDSDASSSGTCSSDDGWSDVDVEDIAAVKFRARTPPWQRAEDSAARGRALMLQRPAPQTCLLWDTSESEQRLVELRQRRLQRPPDPVQLSPSAVAAAQASGLIDAWSTAAAAPAVEDGSITGSSGTDPADLPLPKDIIHALLHERFTEKYTRLGLPQLIPGGSKRDGGTKQW